MASKSNNRQVIDQIFILLGCALVVAFVFMGSLAAYGYNFATSEVHDELSSQKVYFPAAGSASFSPTEFPDIQQYAGQMVDNGPKAQAYANGFIGRHLKLIAGGKTYAEVSALAMADPTNQALQQQKATLFQGETLRGLLLGDGYAYWTFGQIAGYAAVGFFVGAFVMAVLVALGFWHKSKISS